MIFIYLKKVSEGGNQSMNTQLKRSICPYCAAKRENIRQAPRKESFLIMLLKGKYLLDFQIRIFPYCVAKEKIFIRLSEKNLS